MGWWGTTHGDREIFTVDAGREREDATCSRPTAPRKPSRWRRSASAARISVLVLDSGQPGHGL